MVRDDYYREDRRDRGDRWDDRRDTRHDDRREPGRDMDDYDRRDERRDRDMDRRDRGGDRDDYDRPQRRDRDHPPSRGRHRPPTGMMGQYPFIKPMIYLIVAVVLLGIAIGTAWWHNEITTDIDETDGPSGTAVATADFKKDEVDWTSEVSGDYYEGIKDDDGSDDYNDFGGGDLDEIEDTFGIAGNLTILAMVLAIVAIVFVIICGMRFLPFNIAVIICLVTLLISLIAPIYFAATIGDAAKKDDYPGDDGKIEAGDIKLGPIGFIYMGDDSDDTGGTDVKVSILCYPTIGWFMAVAAIIFCAIAFVQVRRMSKLVGPSMYGAGAPRGPPPRGRDRDYDDYDRPPPRERDRDSKPPRGRDQYRDDYDDRDRPQRERDRERAPPPDEYDDDRNDRNKPQRQERPKDRDRDYYDERPPPRPPY